MASLGAHHSYAQEPRQCLAEFCRDFLLQKYGLPSLVEGYLFLIVKLITKHATKHPRLWVFGALTGVVVPLRWSTVREQTECSC